MVARSMDRASRDVLNKYQGLKRSQHLKVDLTDSIFNVLCKGSRVERVSAYQAIKDQVMAQSIANAKETAKLSITAARTRAGTPGGDMSTSMQSTAPHVKMVGGGAGQLDLPRLQLKLIRALIRPIGSSDNLRDREDDTSSKEYAEFHYDVDEYGTWYNNIETFIADIEGRNFEEDEGNSPESTDNPLREFSGDQDGAKSTREWLLPALGYLGGVEHPINKETRRIAFRLLLSYTLDANDNEIKSSYTPPPAVQRVQAPPKEEVKTPAVIEAEAKVKEAEALLAAAKGVPAKEEKKPPRENRGHLRSKSAFHALDAILHGFGFTAVQRWAAIKVVLGNFSLKALCTADWVALALNETSSGIHPIQWMALLWLTVQEQEDSREDLGIFLVDRSAPAWKSFSHVWMEEGYPKNPGVDGSARTKVSGDLVTLMLPVFDAGRSLDVKNKEANRQKDAIDIKALPFGLTDSLAYIFPEALVDSWLEICQRTVAREEGAGEWSDREIIRHFLLLRGGREGQGGGIQTAIMQLPKKEASAKRRAAALALTAYMRNLSKKQHRCWDGVLTMALECIKANAKFAEEEDKTIALRDVLAELTNDNPTIVREATLTLIAIRGPTGAVKEMVQVAQTCSGDIVEALATALRLSADGDSGKKDEIVNVLEEHTQGGSEEQQSAARRLMQEFGGSAAMKKLAARSTIGEKYTDLMKETGDKVQKMFDKSLEDARRGFAIALFMDVTLFMVGIFLIILSAVTGILHSNSGNLSWEGTGISGGTGALAIGYSAFVSKPRAQVKAATDHLMYIKVVFLGYLRELGQVDQAFTRRLMEDKFITQDELSDFADTLERIMKDTSVRMTAMLKTTDHQLAAAMEDKDKGGAAGASGALSMFGLGGGAGGGVTSSLASASDGRDAETGAAGGLGGGLSGGTGFDAYNFKGALMDLLRSLMATERKLAGVASPPTSMLTSALRVIERAMDDSRAALRAALGAATMRDGGGGGAAIVSPMAWGAQDPEPVGVAPTGASARVAPVPSDAVLARVVSGDTALGPVPVFSQGPVPARMLM